MLLIYKLLHGLSTIFWYIIFTASGAIRSVYLGAYFQYVVDHFLRYQ